MNPRTTPLILIVDDIPGNLQVVGNILENCHFDIALAQSGVAALEFAAKELPDLILLDIMMPGLDGFETCRSLKAQESTAHIPVIFLTAKSETEDIVKGFSAGAVDYVVKPFQKDELIARVTTHVELKRAREEIKTLKGFLPVCAGCKSIRNEQDEWMTMEEYLTTHSDAVLSHGLCPGCIERLYPEISAEINNGQS